MLSVAPWARSITLPMFRSLVTSSTSGISVNMAWAMGAETSAKCSSLPPNLMSALTLWMRSASANMPLLPSSSWMYRQSKSPPAIPMARPKLLRKVKKGCFLRLLQAIFRLFFSMFVFLFRSQASGRIDPCGPYGLVSYGYQGNAQGHGPGQDEHPSLDVHPIGEAL